MISKVFIERPRFAMVISIVITLAGALSMFRLPITQYPSVTPPSIQVTTSYPGANASVIASTIAAPIESAVNGVEDMIYMSSSSDNNGAYSLQVTFEVGTDIDIAQVKVQNRVQQAMAQLPAAVTQQGVNVQSASPDILGFFAFRSPNGTFDENYLSNYVDTQIKNNLKRIKGVSGVQIYSSVYSMRVWLDPDRMAALKIGSEEVAGAIETQNVQAVLGSVGTGPGDGTQMLQYSLQAEGRLNTVEEFEQIIVRTNSDLGIVRLKDIARIELGAQSYTQVARYNGGPCVIFSVQQTPGSNAIDAIAGVRSELDRLSESFPEDVEYALPYDSTKYVNIAIREIIITLSITFLLVVIVCYLFLQDWRATLIPSLTIPVSLFGTFGFLAMLGYSINTLTLFALILAIGLVVDDAIVVVENVLRIMDEEGLDHKAATKKAMGQISGAVIATTLVLLAIFVPVGFISGITGKIYQQFAVTISIAVLISTLNALTLSPALCATILHVAKPKQHGPLAWFNVVVDACRNGYVRGATWIARRIAITLIFFGFITFLGLKFSGMSPTSFLPMEDEGTIFMNVQLPEGATLPRTLKVIDEIEEIIETVPAVEATISISGFSFMSGNGENVALVVVRLKDWDQRPTDDLHISAISGILTQKVSAIPDAQIMVFTPPPIRGLGMAGGIEFKLQATGDQDPHKLDAVLKPFLGKLFAAPEIMFGFSSYNASTPQIFLDVDRAKAEMLKVDVTTVFNALVTSFGARYVNDINKDGQVYQVRVQSEWEHRKNLEDIEDLHVKNRVGKMVPLGSLLTRKVILEPRTVSRFNQFASAGINAFLAPGATSGQGIAAVEKIAKESLPDGYTISWSGVTYQEQKASGSENTILMGMALLFGFLFLVAQYESWTTPLAVILSVMVAVTGAVIGLFIMQQPLSIYAQLGLVLLVGLASKNAILIVEFSKEKLDEGMDLIDAAAAGAKTRFRAVLMTAFTFILGVVPMLIATGAGSASRKSIGITVFSGMVAATLVGIFLIPGLYAASQRWRFFAKRLTRKSIPEDVEEGELNNA